MNALSLALPPLLPSPNCALAEFCQSRQLRACWTQNRFCNTAFLSSCGWLHVRKLKGMSCAQKRRICRAELVYDAPFAVAIGACVLVSLIFPLQDIQDNEGERTPGDFSLMGASDVRYGTMSIISFIPLFNWLAWVFAWLDTSERRYLIYSIVYLAPYIRTGFSLSTDDSWLPAASLIACIIHVQLEISVNTGGQEGMEFFKDATNFFSTKMKFQELQANRFLERLQQNLNLPGVKIEEWEFPSQEDFQNELNIFDKKLAMLERLEADEGKEFLENAKAKEIDSTSGEADETGVIETMP
eukprot:c25964_g1_i2 orf=183-1079(+)